MASFALKDIEDQLKDLNDLTSVFGVQQTATRKVQIESNFRYNLPPEDFLVPDTNTGLTGVGNGVAFADSNTLTGSTKVEDKDTLRYRAGTESGFIFTAAFPETDPEATQRVGGFDAEDGMFVGHNGTNPFVGRRRGGVDTTVELEDEDWSGLNVFRLEYGYLGAAPLTYKVLRDDGWETLHQFTFFNSPTSNFVRPDTSLRLEVVADADVDARAESASWMAYSLNPTHFDPQLRAFTRKAIRETLDTATQEHILTIGNKETFQGEPNVIELLPTSATFTVSADAYIEVFAVRNATFGTALTYTDVDTESSVSEFSRDNVTVTGYDKLLYTDVVPGEATGNNLNLQQGQSEAFEEQLIPGESITFFATTDGTPNFYATSAQWQELF